MIKKNKSKKRKYFEHFEHQAPNSKIFHDYVIKEEGQLMNYLLVSLSGQSRNNIKSLLSKHQVQVNHSVETKFDFPLEKGDIVTISLYPNGQKTLIKCPYKVLYEDESLIAIDKPSGILSVNDEKEDTKTCFHQLMVYEKSINIHAHLYVVHRLDKDTSGVLLFAKNEEIQQALQEDWNEIVTNREYVGIVEGIFKEKTGTKISYLKENKTCLVYSTNDKDGEKAITHYEVLDESKNYSLVKVKIDTGKKNQIRVHMKDMNHLILGDKKYGSNNDPLKRLCLHARCLEFINPLTKQEIKIVSPTPFIFKKLLKENKVK